MIVLTERQLDHVRGALAFSGRISGKTHNFYHYPARFPPELARAVIGAFSRANDWVLDPFMGGGTSIVEGLALGRQMAGVDINALAHFVTTVRTTPLSEGDEKHVAEWAQRVSKATGRRMPCRRRPCEVRNLPRPIGLLLARAKRLAKDLPTLTARSFATCALLRLGQCALDCRDTAAPRQRPLSRQLPRLLNSMTQGLRELALECRASGVRTREIRNRRILLNRDAEGIGQEPALRPLLGRVKLVITSPPYPGVHVLYHRWQYRGRKETPAPYWIASLPDGNGAAFYTLGSRTPTGIERYFGRLEVTFRSLIPLLDRTAVIAQLVAFADPESQLQRYLGTMQEAGYIQLTDADRSIGELTRRVPNRKWYARSKPNGRAASELLLLHTPRSNSLT